MCKLCRLGADIHHKNTEGADAFFISAMTEYRPGLMFLATQGAKVRKGPCGSTKDIGGYHEE